MAVDIRAGHPFEQGIVTNFPGRHGITTGTKIVANAVNESKSMKLPDIYTIGVYGSSESEFFKKLIDQNIDTFCDIRLRRAVRGSQYVFANSQRLQDKLAHLSIKYLHETGLAPTPEIIKLQDKFDKEHKIQRRKREELTDVFKTAYTNKILSKFDVRQFIKSLEESGSKKAVLFCVERSADACHRSLVTTKIKELHPDIKIFNL